MRNRDPHTAYTYGEEAHTRRMAHDPRLRPGWSIPNIQQALARLGTQVGPFLTFKLGLEEVEYVSHVVSSTGISLTPEKRLKVLNFPRPQKREAHFYNLLALPITSVIMCRT